MYIDILRCLEFVLVYIPAILFWITLAVAIRIYCKDKKHKKWHEDDGK